MSNRKKARRSTATISVLGTTQIHLRNPWVAAWWSAAFPGFGHLLLSKYLRGFLLFLWEMVINMQAKINTALYYSFTGRFSMAKDVLDPHWMLLYTAIYLFSVWDSYRTSIELNKLYILSERENAPIESFIMNAADINYLDKKTPWVTAVWSFLMPGTGHLYIHRILSAFFILISWIIITIKSHFLLGVHYAFVGEFAASTAALDPQWLLFLPSIVGFAVYDSFVNTVENNKLFDKEQAHFLKTNYQNKPYELPNHRKT